MSHLNRLQALSDSDLLTQTETKASEERRITTEFLWHLHEVHRRRLFAAQGFSSLFEYLCKALRYSEGSAGRRISAMLLLCDLPEAEQALKAGTLSLSVASTAQTF